MKTRNKFSFSFFLYTLFLLLVMAFSSCTKTKFLCGYIPVGEKIQVNWPDPHGGPVRTIHVITSHGDTINAIAYEQIPGDGGWSVIFRDTRPNIRDQKVFVMMRTRVDGDYEIFRVIKEDEFEQMIQKKKF